MSKDLINGEASIPCIWHGMEVTLEQGVEEGARSRGGAEPTEGSYMFYGYTCRYCCYAKFMKVFFIL